jgi:hypothetical protein
MKRFSANASASARIDAKRCNASGKDKHAEANHCDCHGDCSDITLPLSKN